MLTKKICLDLHQEIVFGHAAVDQQLFELQVRVCLHGVEDLADLKKGRSPVRIPVCLLLASMDTFILF